MSKCKHTPQPNGYVQWHNWAEKKSKTHTPEKCTVCGEENAVWIKKKTGR